MEERYEPMKELNFGFAILVRDKKTKELVQVKYIERGMRIDENVQRKIINHMSLRHPNIVRFKEIADVWLCGVTLYVMLVGEYPFEDPEDHRNYRKTIDNIVNVQYSIPDYVDVSSDCRHLLSRIFVANPSKRITIPEIKERPWFLKNLPKELAEADKTNYEGVDRDQPKQSVEEIMQIIQEAQTPAEGSKVGGPSSVGTIDPEDVDEDEVDNSDDSAAVVQP